jgi:8-oxo-dGTP pyrophosphatase MutT (NUDIX family)
MPNGKDGIYGVIESKNDGVYVIPVDDKGNTYIVRQEHYTVREAAWQCVAGRDDNEPVELAAKRELLEEAGLRAESITVISQIRSATGTSTFRGTVCLARSLTPDSSSLDKNEITEIKKVPLSDIMALVLKGEIVQAEGIAAFMMVQTYLEQEKIGIISV